MTPVQAVGESLNNWQLVYIVSITVALLSTFAIVVFAFHVREYRHGLQLSNYIYVLASLLAVVSTMRIVAKTRSLDVEKDRLASIQIGDTTKLTKQAQQKAEEARQKAENVEQINLILRSQLERVGHKQSSDEDILNMVNTATASRALPFNQTDRNSFDRFRGSAFEATLDMTDSEAIHLQQLMMAMLGPDLPIYRSEQTGFDKLGPLGKPGIHIRTTDLPNSSALGAQLAKTFTKYGLRVDVAPASKEDLYLISNYGRNQPQAILLMYIGPRR